MFSHRDGWVGDCVECGGKADKAFSLSSIFLTFARNDQYGSGINDYTR